jgi:hypothetical protein
MDLARLRAFADEIEKISARKGIKLIKSMVQKGDIAGASSLAKNPKIWANRGRATIGTPNKSYGKGADTVSKSHYPEESMRTQWAESPTGQKLWKERDFPGSQIKGMGRGGESEVALVADPEHGIVVRKIRHAGAMTPERVPGDPNQPFSMPDTVASLTQEKGMEPYAARVIERARHPLSGKHITFQEYVPEKIVDVGEQSLAAGAARRKLEEVAAKRGIHVDDLKDVTGPNYVYTTDPVTGKPTAKIIDFTAHRKASPVGLGAKSKGEPIGQLYNDLLHPPAPMTAQYDREIAAEIRRLARSRRGPRPSPTTPPPF